MNWAWCRKWRSGADRSRDFNRLYGEYRVIYPDGLRSEPMCFDVAENYRKIFGGQVVEKE